MLTLLIGFGAIAGASEGIKASQRKSRREEHRSRKNNLIVHCPKSSEHSMVLEGRQVVLSGDKIYIDTGKDHDMPFGHPFAGYYLAYPDTNYVGLVSTITDEAPIMNWVFVHRETYELKFGTRQFSEGNFTGPFDCTRQDRRLTFGGWEGFCAVKEGSFWAVYFDRDSDKLRSKIKDGTPVIEIELIRKEIRASKPEAAPQSQEGKCEEDGKKEPNGVPQKSQGKGDPEQSEEPELPPSPDAE